MSLKRLSRVFGSIFDVAALSEIPDDDCHVIFVSGRTLYLMQHFGNNEVNFLARYADSFSEDGRYYDAVDLDSPNVDLVQRTAQDYRLEVLDMQCADVITAIDNLAAQIGLINVAIQGTGGCGCDGGEFDPEALDNGDVGEFDQAYLDGKCETANIIVDKVQYAIRQLDVVNIDVLLLGGISAASAVIGALVLAGPVGWGTVLAIGVISGILLLLAQLGVGELGDIDTAISANQDDLVCELFSATSTEAAKTGFLDVLDGASIGAVGQGIVGFMLFNDVLNQLFVPSGTYIGQTYEYLNDDYTATDCTSACDAPMVWTFATDEEGWTFTDLSDNGGAAQGEHSAENGALQVDFQTDGGADSIGVGQWSTTEVNGLSVPAGTVVEAKFSAPSDGILTAFTLQFRETGFSPQEVLLESTEEETLSLEANGGAILWLRVLVGRSNGPGGGGTAFDASGWIEYVSISVAPA
jgi:hypothetical protein